MIDLDRYNRIEYLAKHSLHYKSSYRREIIELIKKIKSNPDFYFPHEGLGLYLSENGLYEEALEEYNIVMDLAPDYYEIYTSIGINFLKMGKTEEAERFFKKALKFNEYDDEAIFFLGKIAVIKENLDDGLEKMKKGIQLDPEYSYYHNELGIIYLKIGKYHEAAEEFKSALRFDPTCTGYYNSLSQALIELNQLTEAEKILRKAIDLDKNDDLAHNNLADLLSLTGRIDEAIDEAKKALKINPNNYYAHGTLGICYYKTGKIDKAEEQYRKSIRVNPDYPVAHSNLGILLFNKKQYGEAITEFETAVALDPYDVHLNVCRTIIENYKEVLEEAVNAEYESYIKSMISDYLDHIAKSDIAVNSNNSSTNDDCIFVPDTNALIDMTDFSAYEDYETVNNSSVILTPIVLKELDHIKQKNKDENAKFRARNIIRLIDDLKRKGDLFEGVKYSDRITIKWSAIEPDNHTKPAWLDYKENDDYILGIVLELQKIHKNALVTLVTSDINLSNKAAILKIKCIKPKTG